MFKALRDYFSGAEARPPRRRRARRLVQLFAFEFVVVLLGVLAAQLLQDWYAERKDARRAQAVLAAFAGETRRFVTTAEYRDRAHACEMARLARLAELVRTGGTADEAERATPLMPMPIITDWSDDTRQIVARHAGETELADAQAARAYAVKAARSLAAETVTRGHIAGHHRIEIVDENREPVDSVRFDEAVDFRP